jgi:hypothetical protein
MSARDGIALYFGMWMFLWSASCAWSDESACKLAAKQWEEDLITRENALNSCEAPAKAGSVEAQFHMAEFLKMEDKSRAKEWAQLAAAKYFMPAVFLLSEFEPNEIDTLKLIRRAAEAGYPKAQFKLGELYVRDEKLSVEWKTKAAEGGFRKAQLELGRMYEDLDSESRDEVKAKYWFTRALDAKFEPLLAAKLDPTAFERPMQFYTYYPCAGSGCQLTVLGIGQIEIGSAAKLAAIDPPTRASLYLHSPGGNLLGGLALGQEIRKRQLHTIVGAPESSDDSFYLVESADDLGILVKQPICASSCAYAFLGGVARTVVEPNRLLFHQFLSKSGVSLESHTQETVALLNSYIDEMNIARQALDPALLNRPEQLGYLSERDLQRYRVTTPDLKEALTYDELVQLSEWKLAFEGSTPRVEMARPTNYNTGQVILALSKAPNLKDFRLSVRVAWANEVEQEYVRGWQGVMFDATEKPLEVLVCLHPEISEAPETIQGCKTQLFSLKAPRSNWLANSYNAYVIHYEISAEQYQLILAKRPRYLELIDPLPNSLREMRFSREIILTEEFYKIASLFR